jgi:hypothetical protein
VKRAIWLAGALLLTLLPVGYANADPSPLTVSISGLDPNKTNLVPAVINHVRVFLPKSEWATCTVSPTQSGDLISYTWTVEHPGALDQAATVVSTDKKYYLSWMFANPALDSFLTCRVTVVRDGVTLQGANSVFVSHELPLVRLAIYGVPIDASVQPGGVAVCSYTANGDNSVVSFAWSVASRPTGEGDVLLSSGRTFAFTAENLALLKNRYLICRAHSGVSPYYLDSIASALIADRPAFRPSDLAKASVAAVSLPTFDMSTYLTNGNVYFGIDSSGVGILPGSMPNMIIHPGQVVTSQITLGAEVGIKRMEEKVYDAIGRLVYVIPFVSSANTDGSLTWSSSWTVPKATTIYASGYWQMKVVATRAADLQNAPTVTIASVQVAGIVGSQIPCSMNSGTMSTQSITATTYC